MDNQGPIGAAVPIPLATQEQSADANDAAADSSQAAAGALRGNLGVRALVLTVIAYNGPMIILAGIVPVVISIGNGLGAPLIFATLGLLVALFAVGLNAMAVRMTHAGAFYTYVTAGLGRAAGLSAGLIAIVAYILLSAGTIAIFSTSVQLLLSNTFGVTSGPPWWVWSLLAIATVTILSLFNIELSAKVLGIASSAEILIAIVWNFRVYANGGPEGRAVNVFGSYFSGSFALALVFGVLCLTGFESLQVFRSETRDAKRTVPRATYISIAIMTSLYAVSSYAYIVAFGASKAIDAGSVDPTGSVLTSIAQYVARPVADIANCLLITSTFAATLAVQSILARYLFAFAKDGIIPTRISAVSRKHGSPMVASGVAGLATLVTFGVAVVGGLSATDTFASLTGAGAYCLVVLYAVTSVAIVAFFSRSRRRLHQTPSLWTAYIAPVTSTLLMGAIVWLSTLHFTEVIGQERLAANIVLAVIYLAALGGLGLGLWYRRRRPDIYARIGNQAEVG